MFASRYRECSWNLWFASTFAPCVRRGSTMSILYPPIGFASVGHRGTFSGNHGTVWEVGGLCFTGIGGSSLFLFTATLESHWYVFWMLQCRLAFPSHPKVNIRVCWCFCVTNIKGRVRPTNVRWGGASNILRNASGGPRNHLTHQMLNLKPFFEYWQFEFACRRQHPLVIPHYLQVAVSAADFSSTRWLDDRMLKRIAGRIVVPERKESNLACLEAWFLGCSVPIFLWIFTNLRGFVDLHGFSKSFIGFDEFPNMFIDFYNLNRVHKILWSFKKSLIFIYFGEWPLKTVRSGLRPL